MSWLRKLTILNKSAQPSGGFILAQRSLELYTKLEEGMAPFFLLCLSSTQITWITYTFLSISIMISGLTELFDVISCLTSFVSAIATILLAISLICCLSDCHKSLEILEDTLADDIIEMAPGRERQEAKRLLKVGLKNRPS